MLTPTTLSGDFLPTGVYDADVRSNSLKIKKETDLTKILSL
jgi:hypothetical protein